MNNLPIATLVLLCVACGPSQVPDGLGPPNPLSDTTTARLVPPAPLSGQQGKQAPSMRATREAVTRDAATAYTLEGRVVDARHESWPEKPVMVRLTVDGTRIEQRLKADGRFRFELEGVPRSATIWVHPAYTSRWRWCVPQPFYAQQLTAKQLAGEQELLLEIAQRRRGRVHGVAIDDADGEPVPGLRFTLAPPRSGPERDKFEPLEVETDELGRFTTLGEVQGGRIELRTRDGDPTPVRKDVDCLIPGDSQAEPWVLRFRSGPVIDLRLTGEVPRDLSSLKVWFLRDGEASALGSTYLHRDAATGRTWIRARSLPLPDGARNSLAVGDDRGLVLGVAPLLWSSRATGEPVEVRLVATAALKLVLEWERPADLRPDEWYARPNDSIRLVPVEAAANTPSFAWRATRLRGLRPGEYTLTVGSREHVEQARGIELEAGGTTEVALAMQLEQGPRTLHGTIETESGEALPDLTIRVGMRARPERWWTVSYSGSSSFCGTGMDHSASLVDEQDPRLAAFELERVPRGELSVSVSYYQHACSFELGERPDGDLDLEVLVLDREGGPGFGFRFVGEDQPSDFSTGLWTRPLDGGAAWPTRIRNGGLLGRSDPTQRELEWAASAAGYRPIFGDEQDFVPEPGGRFFARLHFERGWGARVVVRDTEGAALAGLIVLIDGVPAGRTDGDGVLQLTLDEAPARIELDAPGLRPLPAYPAVHALFGPSEPWHEIVMTP